MSRLNRFLIAGPHPVGATHQLDAERSNYLCRVLRLGEGDAVDIFDGTGGLFQCALSKAHYKRAEITVVQDISPNLAAPPALEIALALLKGSAMDRALQQATELGVTRIHLVQAKRSNVALSDTQTAQKLSHWRRIVASSCEQCGQLLLPPLGDPTNLAKLLSDTADSLEGMVFDPLGEPMPGVLPCQPRLLLIGPEGGWSDDELTLMEQQQVQRCRLGSTILRAQTMPAVALALVQQAQGWS